MFDIRPYARTNGFVGLVGVHALDRFEAARAAFHDTGDRAALARDLFALGVSGDDVRRIAAGESVLAMAAG